MTLFLTQNKKFKIKIVPKICAEQIFSHKANAFTDSEDDCDICEGCIHPYWMKKKET